MTLATTIAMAWGTFFVVAYLVNRDVRRAANNSFQALWKNVEFLLFLPFKDPRKSSARNAARIKVPIWDLVISDMRARDNFGWLKYRVPLTGNNGRDALRDAYEEALDLAVYLRQAIEERDSSEAKV